MLIEILEWASKITYYVNTDLFTCCGIGGFVGQSVDNKISLNYWKPDIDLPIEDHTQALDDTCTFSKSFVHCVGCDSG